MKTKYFEIVSNSNILRGMVHVPQTAHKQCPAVVIVHGYSSANKIGPQGLLVHIADALSALGYYVYRFDLSGMGESDGNIEQVKFADHVADVESVLRYVQAKHSNKPVNVIAHCMGCNCMLDIFGKKAQDFQRVVFMAPFFANDVTLKCLFSPDQLESIQTKGFTYRKGLYADYSFFSQNTEQTFVDRLRAAPQHIDVILAEKDQLSPLECSKSALAGMTNVDVFQLPNADHNFLETQQALVNLLCKIFTK